MWNPTVGPAWATTSPIDGMNGGDFFHINAYVWAFAHVVLGPSFKVRKTS